MSVITLCTDFGLSDSYAAAMKGVILGINPRATIVDVTHAIPQHDIAAAAFVLNGYYRYFPKGTVHVVVVDPGVGGQRYDMVVKTKDHLFVGPDNGVFSFVLMHEPAVCHELKIRRTASATFHGRDVFAPAAARLSLKWEKSILGGIIRRPRVLDLPKPIVSSRGVTGQVVHIDHFGNLITNITGHLLGTIAKNKTLEIFIKGATLHGMHDTYEQCRTAAPCALIDSFGLLEIAVNTGSASKELGARRGDAVKILWK